MPRPKAPSRFGMNEPAAGPIARASHRLNLVAGIVITLLPGLWTLVWNLVMWPAGLATLSNICLSLQLFALGLIVCAHWTTFNFCVYDPMRDWLEEYTGFMFLYRGRAGMLTVLSMLSLGNTQWDAPMFQLLVPLGSSILAAVAAGVSLFVWDRQPELDAVMSEQLEVATEQRLAALASTASLSRDAAVAAYEDGDSDATRSEQPAPADYSQVPRDSISVVEPHAGGATQVELSSQHP